MSDEAHGIEGGVLCPDSFGVERVAEFDGGETGGFAIEDDDVAANGGGIDGKTYNFGDSFGEMLGIGVIFVEAGGRFFEGHEARRREYANLAHAASEHFAIHAGAFDEFTGADDHGAYGRAKPFGEAEHNRVAFLGHMGNVIVECRGGVEDARAVEVNVQAESVRLIADFADAFGGIDGAAGHVAGVF